MSNYFFFLCALISGYGFVDFESPACAEGAVKGLLSKGIQAQMAKVGIWVLHRPAIVRFLLHASNTDPITQSLHYLYPLIFLLFLIINKFFL